jgi:23S rRNA (guanosine2251-2'-O)-methyltransferase
MARHIYGIHPALEALKATPGQVERVFLAEGPLRGPLQEIAQEARKLNLRTEIIDRGQMARLAGGGVHQGVVLKVAEFSYAELPDVCEKAKAAGGRGLVLVLDGIEDPFNLGALIRSALALGAQGVVIPKDRACGVTGTVVKASAGAISHLPVARVTNLARALMDLKDAGMWVVGADMDGDRAPWEVDFQGPIALVVGGEGPGVRKGVLEKCDFVVRIPMPGPLASLNASVAGAILLYEAARQRSGAAGSPARGGADAPAK